MSDLDDARLLVKGYLSEQPERMARVEAAVSNAKAVIEGEAQDLKGIVAFLIFAEYGKEWGL